jgi:hypothetical protein
VFLFLENFVSFSVYKNYKIMHKNKINIKPDINLNKSSINIDPYFITGLTDAEGSFSIMKHKDIRAKYDINKKSQTTSTKCQYKIADSIPRW